jgi:periplasmic glucans biosynthesis protein
VVQIAALAQEDMTHVNRRSFVSLLAALCGAAPAFVAARAMAETVDPRPGPQLSDEAVPFSVEWLASEAKKLAAAPYQERPMVPQEWRDMSYAQHRSIWFNSNRALWQGSERPVRVEFLHPGLYFPRPVEISIVSDGMARRVAFDFDLYHRGEQAPELPLDDTLGYSGFRLRGGVADPGEYKEFVVFQGASYFRAIARGENYGLSARGLALRTADERGEEFPEFTRFWIEAPQTGAAATRIHALLESPSLTGAYNFSITPGDATTMDVSARVFVRSDQDHVGLAPLTSMFLFDETNRNRFDDFRPAVHDSEGLLIANGAGEVLWRPLANPKSLQVSNFMDESPKGFGLLQRSRKFSDFADLESLYHTRPSLWIEPGEAWGPGSVTLVEIPSDREIYDNIVAYWRPRDPLVPGDGSAFTYRMRWGGEPVIEPSVARVLNTRMGKAFESGIVVAVDFAAHEALPDDLDAIRVAVGANWGDLHPGIVQRNPETGGVRLAFTFEPGEAKSIELRAQLIHGDRVVTETWVYRWTA